MSSSSLMNTRFGYGDPMPRTILHVAQPTVDGVARCVADLVRAQTGRGIRAVVASPGDGDLRTWAENDGAEHRLWKALRSPGLQVPLETASLRTIIRSVEPDVVHLHSSKAGLAGRLALRGTRPTVFQPHAWSFEASEGVMRKAAVRWERVAARWSDAIVCVSEAERRAGEAAGIGAPWRVIPNGVDLVKWTAAGSDDRDAARRALGLDDAPLAICVGRLSRQKGQDVLLEAWRSVMLEVPAAHLVFLGAGPEEEALRRLASPSVSFAGRRNDVDKWLAACNLVVLPSRWEGMALTVLEAMARARSVVTTQVAGANETVGDAAGEVVGVEDAGALARALSERLADPVRADAEGRRGRERVEASYDLARTTSEVEDLYTQVLSRRQE